MKRDEEGGAGASHPVPVVLAWFHLRERSVCCRVCFGRRTRDPPPARVPALLDVSPGYGCGCGRGCCCGFAWCCLRPLTTISFDHGLGLLQGELDCATRHGSRGVSHGYSPNLCCHHWIRPSLLICPSLLAYPSGAPSVSASISRRACG